MSTPTPDSTAPSTAFARGTAALFAAFAALCVFSVFYHNTRTTGGGSFVAVVTISALVIGLLFVGRYRIAHVADRIVGLFDRVSTPRFLWGACLVGTLLRLVWSLGVVPEQISDARIYLGLAEHLLATGVYENESDGTRAHFPPGFPFFLLPFVALFGNGIYLPLALNILLFNATALFTFGFGRQVLGPRLARLPVLLIAVWPSLVMGGGIANKEFLVACLVAGSAYCYLRAIDSAGKPGVVMAGLSGLLLGAGILTQPSVLLLGFAYPMLELLRGPGPIRPALSRLSLLVIGGALIISPWTVRNYVVLDAFIPVATNGPIVFWSANNENASGGWMKHDQYTSRDEIAGARQAMRDALTWIREHPKDFMTLTVKRVARFLGSDEGLAFGVPRTLYHEDAAVIVTGKWVANAFWLFLIALIAAGAFLKISPGNQEVPAWGLPLFMVVILLLVHSVFQSEDRHHANVVSMLAVLASVCAGYVASSRRTIADRS